MIAYDSTRSDIFDVAFFRVSLCEMDGVDSESERANKVIGMEYLLNA